MGILREDGTFYQMKNQLFVEPVDFSAGNCNEIHICNTFYYEIICKK